MKKPLSFFVRIPTLGAYIFLLSLGFFGANATEQGPLPTTIINEALYMDLMMKDGVLHLVWDETQNPDVISYVVERSTDYYGFQSVANIGLGPYFDVHAHDYPQDYDYFHRIVYSTEKGWGRFIFNEYLADIEPNPYQVHYRILMLNNQGDKIFSRTLTIELGQNGTNNSMARGGPCPSVQTPPSGATWTGNLTTNTGDCCTWEEREYTVVGGGSSPCGPGTCCCGISGTNSSGHSSCQPCGYDDCCVHTCISFSNCSCTWPCCNGSSGPQWYVTSSTTYSSNYPVITFTNIQNIGCNNANIGSASISVGGGVAPVTSMWSNGTSGTDVFNLAAGTYWVTAEDSRGCETVASVTIVQAPPMNISLTTQQASCPVGNNAILDVTVIGGTAPFTYTWSNGDTTQDLNGVGPGVYFITVSDDNFCTASSFSAVNAGAPSGLPGIWEWIGDISNDWFNPCNWDKKQVPNQFSEVYIPGPTLHQPLIANDTGYCKDVLIIHDQGGHLTTNRTSGGFLEKTP